MKRAVVFSLVATLFFACKDGGLVEPDEIDDALLAIADGAHAGSIPGFYFLPPLVPQPNFAGDFEHLLVGQAIVLLLADFGGAPNQLSGLVGGEPAIVLLLFLHITHSA